MMFLPILLFTADDPSGEGSLTGQVRCPTVRILFGAIELGFELEVAHLKIMLDLSTNVRDHVQKVVEVVDDSL